MLYSTCSPSSSPSYAGFTKLEEGALTGGAVARPFFFPFPFPLPLAVPGSDAVRAFPPPPSPLVDLLREPLAVRLLLPVLRAVDEVRVRLAVRLADVRAVALVVGMVLVLLVLLPLRRT